MLSAVAAFDIVGGLFPFRCDEQLGRDRVKPQVTVSVGGGGSGTGFDALLRGLTDIADSSRRIDTHELERAMRLQLQPKEHIVGYDALAVYLHKDNPLRAITFSQLAEIFGRNAQIKHWSDLGVGVPGSAYRSRGSAE